MRGVVKVLVRIIAALSALSKVPINKFHCLKVLTNEKSGGLKVVAFNGSPFKLFTLRYSNKSVQAPFCERSKTSQRTLFLSFEIPNNGIALEDDEKIRETCMPIVQFKHRY
jgi:hypothetical protein